MQKLLTSRQTADLLGINEQTVRSYVREGKIEAIRLGDKYIRIRPESLEMFLSGATVKASL